ncbi:phage terminase large subunit [Thalassospira sp. MCCC 1A01428]|uniref:phage terminase large subunit n=1 Tax=Thalassospira sp. MCCC 1A01428 TaxID=1470575 RepID=UPI000A1F36FA|nr:phage terminase large subunit [Thalassospira sp. MCCC 1A01428]OSQ41489.1 hypothetical protein THS27_18985 [Thalassospira sp. MCCC 1A01428]
MQKCQASLAEFVWIWNRKLGQGTPAHHQKMAQWLQHHNDHGPRELLLMAFRNSGKSTMVGLFCAWLLYCNADLRILVLAADLDLAKKMVRNVKRIVERHPLTKAAVPGKLTDWGAERFTINRPGELRDPSMQAAGIGGNITGSRADVVICDDVEVPKTCDTAHKREELREKLGEISYVLSPGGMQVFIGTPHSYYSIYADETRPETGEDAPFLNGFSRFCLPITDENGLSAWPERFSAAKIEQIRARTAAGKFASQMMLEMVPPDMGDLDPARIKPYDDDAEFETANGEQRLRIGDRRMVAASCHFDPSFGGKGQDGAVIAAIYMCDQGEYWLHDVAYLQSDPACLDREDEASQLCRQVAAFAKRHHLPVVRVETNGIGRFLPNILRRCLNQAGCLTAVVEFHETRNKEARIADAFGAVLAAGLLHGQRNIWRTPFIREMREWRPNGGNRDDGLDAVAGCILAEPVRLPRVVRPDFGRDWRPASTILQGDPDFDP